MGGDDFWCAERTTHKGVPNGGRGEREREGKIGGKKRRKNEINGMLGNREKAERRTA